MMSKNKPKTLSEAPEGALSGKDGKYITRLEYICIMLSRAGSQFGTTLTGTLATTFLLELYFGPFGVSATEIASISAVQTTLTMILGLVMGVVTGYVVQHWKTRFGRYRH